jgi:ketosteroid isomerase-like protein
MTDPDEAALKAIVSAVYAHAGVGDWDGAERYLADDLVIIEADHLPYAGHYTGRRALRELHGIVMAHWIDPVLEFHAMTAGDGHVVSLVTFHLTSRRSGRRLAMPLAEVFRIAAGQVVEIRPFYFDTKALAQLERP